MFMYVKFYVFTYMYNKENLKFNKVDIKSINFNYNILVIAEYYCIYLFLLST